MPKNLLLASLFFSFFNTHNTTTSWLWRLMLVKALLFSGVVVGQTVIISSTPGNYTFTVPFDATSIKVQAWGGGGPREVDLDDKDLDSGSGDGGSYASSILPGALGQIINYNIDATVLGFIFKYNQPL